MGHGRKQASGFVLDQHEEAGLSSETHALMRALALMGTGDTGETS